jgi:hypothetical protein
LFLENQAFQTILEGFSARIAAKIRIFSAERRVSRLTFGCRSGKLLLAHGGVVRKAF